MNGQTPGNDDDLPPLIDNVTGLPVGQTPAPAPAPAPASMSTTPLPVLINAIEKKEIDKALYIINNPNNTTILTRKTSRDPSNPQKVFHTTALMAAVKIQDEMLVEKILEKMKLLGQQNYIGTIDTSGKTAADYASILGLANIAAMIVEVAGQSKVPIILSRDVECRTPLHCVLQSPANVNQINKIIEDTAYMKSVNKKILFKALVLAIQKYPENKDVYGKVIGDLLDKADKGKTEATLGEVWKSDTSIFKDSSESDADKKYTLFMYVAMTPGGDAQLMDILLSRVPYAYITARDVDGNTMLHHLAKTPGPEKLELLKLLKNKKKYAPKLINNNNEPPIFLAVKSGNTEMALKLFEDYPENQINATNQNEGNTLLIEASKVRMIPLLKLLHDMLKVDFEIKNKEGKKASDYVELTTEYLVPTAATTLELASNPIYEKNVAVTDQVKAMFFDIMNFSMCPVCLVIVVSDEGCTYVNHKCAKELRHEALYQKYKDKTEEITWCKLCGGIAVSHGDGVLLRTHQHVSYIPIDQLATTPVTLKPMPTTFYHHDMSISDAICLAGRGRGFPEKYGRIFTYYNELCKLEEQLKQGQKLTRKRVYTKLIETVWASSETENLIPNTYEIIKRFSPRLVEYRKAHKEDLQKINDTMPVGTKEEKKAKDDVIFARSSKQTNLMIDAAEEDVDPVFKEFNVVLLCNLRSGQTVNNDNQSMSNIAASQSMSNIAASQSSSNVATTDNTNRDVVFLEERNKLYNKLDEKIKALADSDPNFVYKRHESEIGEEKDSYQNSSIKKDENNECFQELGPHSDNRPTYKFTHYQVGTSNPKKYVEHSGAVCAAHLRSALDTNSAVSNVKPFPLDRLVNQLAPDERYIGVTCTLSIGAETCLGHIFPDQLNQIPDREFFLPVDLETEVFDEETLIRKGKEFKKQYNIDFMKNHITSDYDIMYATKTSMTGGAEDFISDISELVHRGEALCALHAPQQKAGIRIKTYRRKAALRHGTRRV